MMRDWLNNLGGEGFASAVIWTALALLALVAVLVIVRIVRNFSSGTFIAGGRNRAPRLAVVDAAAVDDKRRLVLVRRDEVEHLILIGGPTDIVVEQQIRTQPTPAPTLAPRPRPRPEPPAPPPIRPAEPPRPAPAPPPPQRPEPPMTAARPERPQPVSEKPVVPVSERPVVPSPAPSEVPDRMAPERRVPPAADEPPREAGAPVAPPRREDRGPEAQVEVDTAFLEEMEPATGEPRPRSPAAEAASQQRESSIEDEMSRLLNELSDERKGGS